VMGQLGGLSPEGSVAVREAQDNRLELCNGKLIP
jgi:hypothetical protein